MTLFLLWKVIQSPASALGRSVELGQFEFCDEQLSFRASDNLKNSLLEFCLLRVSTTDPPDDEIVIMETRMFLVRQQLLSTSIFQDLAQC